jgi:hypothetical protein
LSLPLHRKSLAISAPMDFLPDFEVVRCMLERFTT